MNDNKTNPETCMPAACTVRAAHEAQRVADPQGITTLFRELSRELIGFFVLQLVSSTYFMQCI